MLQGRILKKLSSPCGKSQNSIRFISRKGGSWNLVSDGTDLTPRLAIHKIVGGAKTLKELCSHKCGF